MKNNGHPPGISCINCEHIKQIKQVLLQLTLHKYSNAKIKKLFKPISVNCFLTITTVKVKTDLQQEFKLERKIST